MHPLADTVGFLGIAGLQRKSVVRGLGIEAVVDLVDGATVGDEVREVEQHLAVEIAEGQPAVLSQIEYLLLPCDQLHTRIELQRKRTAHLAADIGVLDLDPGLAGARPQREAHVRHLQPRGAVDCVHVTGRAELALPVQPVEYLPWYLSELQPDRPAGVRAHGRQGDRHLTARLLQKGQRLETLVGIGEPFGGSRLIHEIFDELALGIECFQAFERFELGLLVTQRLRSLARRRIFPAQLVIARCEIPVGGKKRLQEIQPLRRFDEENAREVDQRSLVLLVHRIVDLARSGAALLDLQEGLVAEVRIKEIELVGKEGVVAAPRIAEVAALLVKARIVVVLLGPLRILDDAARFVETCEALLDGFERSRDLLVRLRNAPRRLLDLGKVLLDEPERLLQLSDKGELGCQHPLGLAFLCMEDEHDAGENEERAYQKQRRKQALTQTPDDKHANDEANRGDEAGPEDVGAERRERLKNVRDEAANRPDRSEEAKIFAHMQSCRLTHVPLPQHRLDLGKIRAASDRSITAEVWPPLQRRHRCQSQRTFIACGPNSARASTGADTGSVSFDLHYLVACFVI